MKKIALAMSILALTACSKVTIENYDQISVGMEKTAVETILGKPSQCEEKTLHTQCQWQSGDKQINISFVADKVTLYQQKGLK